MKTHFSKLLVLLLLSPCLAAAQEHDAAVQMQKLAQVYRYLNRLYVEEVDMAPVVEGAIRGMLEELDPHSTYVDAEEMKQVEASFDGEFSGIGIEFSILRDTIVVANTIVGGPAERVGMRPNDRIVRIDTLRAVGLRQTEVPDYLRGRRGSRVELEVVRPGEPQRLHFGLVRDRIPLNTVDAAYRVDDRTGYVKVNRFGKTTMTEFREAYRKLGKPEQLILDLQGNGGGLLEQAIEMAGFFLPRGAAVVSTEGRALPAASYATQTSGEHRKGRLVVLIDEHSASASEIVSGAIQDWDRGLIVGRTSFGKGLVQRQIPLGDGSAVRITVARYRTPSGRIIQRPYRRGNRREYYLEHLRGYDEREPETGDSTRYLTLRTGRPVYGGGGIRPDLRVETDTTGFSRWYADLIRRGVVNECMVRFLDRSRDSLQERYSGFESFNEDFETPGKLVTEIIRTGEERGVAFDMDGFAASELLMRIQLKALTAQRLFGTEAYYRVMNPARNEAYRQAVALLENGETTGIWSTIEKK